jgi:protein-S-isoprenylcysteine O-methyltransferase Ste14
MTREPNTARSDSAALTTNALRAVVILTASIGLVVFAIAGTVDYWQGWMFVATFGVMSFGITLYLARHDPALLQRRMTGGPQAEKQPAQRVIMAFASIGFVALLVIPALDHRFDWSQVPGVVSVFGNLLVILGWIGCYRVFRENSFAAATIDVAPDQNLVTTGPYAIVRHPMYAAGLVMIAGMPIALGSWWGLIVAAAEVPVLMWRLLDEERFLTERLPGYAAYREKVRFRLLPSVW